MKHALIAALLMSAPICTPAWAEEDLPMPTHWGGTGSAAQSDEETGSVTFGDGAHGARQPAKAEDAQKFNPDGTPVRSKVQVRGWDAEKKKPVAP